MRELNLNGLGTGQSTWINEHTVYTHGYGVVTAYGNTARTDGSPAFWEGGIPSSGDLGEYEPRIYFGQSSPSYSIVGGDDGGSPHELDYPDDAAPSGQVNTTFAGNGGPDVSNPLNRLLYAVRFQEMNILFSQEVRAGSQILYDRNRPLPGAPREIRQFLRLYDRRIGRKRRPRFLVRIYSERTV